MFSNYSSPQVIIIVGCCVLVCATWQIICTIHLTIMSPPHRRRTYGLGNVNFPNIDSLRAVWNLVVTIRHILSLLLCGAQLSQLNSTYNSIHVFLNFPTSSSSSSHSLSLSRSHLGTNRLKQFRSATITIFMKSWNYPMADYFFIPHWFEEHRENQFCRFRFLFFFFDILTCIKLRVREPKAKK